MRKDYLGPAAAVGAKAKEAMKDGRYDDAWGFYQDQKSLYMQHANGYGMTAMQALALDASVHVNLANILRIDKRDHEAFVHILYVVIANRSQPSKQSEQKLSSYFKRCKLQNTDIEEVKKFASSKIGTPDFLAAQSKAKDWIARG